MSRDASKVAFWDGASISVASTDGGAHRLLCEKCGRPDGWTQDGKVITSPGLDGDSIGVRHPVISVFTKIVTHPIKATTAPDLSRDGKWLTFHTAENVKSPGMRLENRRQIFVAIHRSMVATGKLDRGNGWNGAGPGAEMVGGWQSALLPLRPGRVPLHLGPESEFKNETAVGVDLSCVAPA